MKSMFKITILMLILALSLAACGGDDTAEETAVEETAVLCQALGHEIEPIETIPGFDNEQFIELFTIVWAAGCGWAGGGEVHQ